MIDWTDAALEAAFEKLQVDEQKDEWESYIRAALDAAERKVEKLREALEPFAKIEAVLETSDLGTIYEWSLDCDDIRRARAALAETEKTDGD